MKQRANDRRVIKFSLSTVRLELYLKDEAMNELKEDLEVAQVENQSQKSSMAEE